MEVQTGGLGLESRGVQHGQALDEWRSGVVTRSEAGEVGKDTKGDLAGKS